MYEHDVDAILYQTIVLERATKAICDHSYLYVPGRGAQFADLRARMQAAMAEALEALQRARAAFEELKVMASGG